MKQILTSESLKSIINNVTSMTEKLVSDDLKNLGITNYEFRWVTPLTVIFDTIADLQHYLTYSSCRNPGIICRLKN